MPRLENWSIVSGYDLYLAPELQYKRLNGYIFDDELNRFSDGTYIATSTLNELNLKEAYAQTRNTKYILGKPDDKYLKWLQENGMTLEQFQS